MNTVLRNLVYKPGDVVVYFSNIYEAVEKTVAYMAETTPLRARKVLYEFPISHDEMVRRFVEVVKKAKSDGLNVRLAIFDTIVSQPGVRMPFERLVEVCREEGVLSCIDGAHGIGHIPLDLGELDPDFFVSNCHKYVIRPYTWRRASVFLRVSFYIYILTIPSPGGSLPPVVQRFSTSRSATNISCGAPSQHPTASKPSQAF